MVEIVTLDEAKAYCRIDGDDEDGTLSVLIDAATAAVVGVVSASAALSIDPRIKLAVLMLVSHSYDNREDAPEPNGAVLSQIRIIEF